MKRFELMATAGLILSMVVFMSFLSAAGGQSEVSERPDHVLKFRYPEGGLVAAIEVEIADRPDSQARGLMGRTELNCNQGMLFIFEHSQRLSFWMHNTPIPLDMLFIDAQGFIFHIVHQAEPMSDRIYSAPQPGRYVVETCAGFAKNHDIVPGMTVEWHRRP